MKGGYPGGKRPQNAAPQPKPPAFGRPAPMSPSVPPDRMNTDWRRRRRGPNRQLNSRGTDLIAALITELVDRRYHLGLTQAELADKIGVGQSWVSDFENVRATPSLSRLLRYAHAVDAKLIVVSR